MRKAIFRDTLAKLDRFDFVTEFKPDNSEQEDFCTSLGKKYTEFVIGGGNNTGKTLLEMMCQAWWTIPEKDINGLDTGYTINPYRKIRIPQTDGGEKPIQTFVSCWSDKVQQHTIQPVFDRIMKGYIKNQKREGGAYHWVETDCAKITFMWQEMGYQKYTGAKLHLATMDEPHKEIIYAETQARLKKWRGVSVIGLTPIVDPDSPISMRDVIWMRDKLIIPYEENPASRPRLKVVYLDVANSSYLDLQDIQERDAGMSAEEIAARQKGRFLIFLEGHAFNQEMIGDVKRFLIAHPEIATPEYGKLEYDPQEQRIDSRVHFVEERETFPDKPRGKDGFIIKIWQHPIKPTLNIRPQYYMGVDASTGKSQRGDPSAIYVKRRDTHQVVAALHGYLDEVQLASQIWLLGHYYCDMDMNPAMVAVETVSAGTTALSYLQTGLDTKYVSFPPYDWAKIYCEPLVADLRVGIHRPSDRPGFFTSGGEAGKRHFLVTEMRLDITESYYGITDPVNPAIMIPDKAFWHEAEYFIRDQSGTYRAAQGETDDRLFADALADMAMKQGYEITPSFQEQQAKENKSSFFVDEHGIMRINTSHVEKPTKAKGYGI